MKRNGIRLLCCLLSLCMTIFLFGCDSGAGVSAPITSTLADEDREAGDEPIVSDDGIGEISADESWAIYWYLCGSDLETEGGAASADLAEMTNIVLPENINVVVQTGGAMQWQNDYVDASAMYRLAYSGNEVSIVDTVENASMGDPNTLADFLSFCELNYPADNKMLLFWNHGSGSAGGVCYDELYDNDFLTMDKIGMALDEVYGKSEGEACFEIIGFDSCLMGAVDVASYCAQYANYMTASEEVEPGCGWQYDAWLGALADNPGMDGAALGTAICDSYYDGCEAYGVESSVTLSTIDLSKIGPVVEAMDALSVEAIVYASENGASEFFAEYGRGARRSQVYGDGDGGMVDIVSLVSNNAELFPGTGETLIERVQDCVVYQRTGPYRADSYGLAAYFPYSYIVEEYQTFSESAASQGLSYLYELLFSGQLSEAASEFFMTEMQETDTEIELESEYEFADVSGFGYEDHPVSIARDGEWTYAQIEVGSEAAEALQYVAFALVAFDEDDTMTYVGEYSNVDADWENGVFTDMFTGGWGSIDGQLVMTTVSAVTEEYVLYEVPILYNGEQCVLEVAYIPADGTYEMLAVTPDAEDGVPSKEQYLLKPGDEIIPIFAFMGFDEEEAEFYEGETITIAEDTSFGEASLPDGQYGLLFMMTDYAGEQYMSELVRVEINDGIPIFTEF